MKIRYYSLCRRYDIPVKLFEPEGEVSGTVTAVHGFGGDMESAAVSALAERMTARGCAVVTFCLPGHGISRADEHFSAENCRLDLMYMFRYTRELYPAAVRRAVFATSFGGYLTLLSLGEIPEKTRLVLRAPAVDMRSTFENLLPISISELKQSGTVAGPDGRRTVSYGFYEELCENDISCRCFDREMLILHGDRDDVVLPEHIHKFCRANPKARLAVIPGADHRFRGEGEIPRAVGLAEGYILGEA
ncbi:MAG: alpha/beta hydrolase [Ruminococcus sp.]|nr:alpha/beta hydrolase [Ruminococcus sp.]